MKIAYLMHSDRPYEELVETIKQLTKQDDHVFMMINDDDLREKVHFVYMDYPKFHMSRTQEFAQEGDMSLARGTLLQMRDALERDDFDYFINLTDGMLPLKSRDEIIDFLEKNAGTDFYYVDHSEKDDPKLRKKTLKYYPFTNLLAFPRGKVTRSITRGFANIINALSFHRTLEDEIQIGSPWFMLTAKSAAVLVKNLPYCSDTFKLSWYAEEMYIPMMFHKFVTHEVKHVNRDYRVVGPTGSWIASQNTRPLTFDLVAQHPEALFGGAICAEEDAALYADYFDIYNRNLE